MAEEDAKNTSAEEAKPKSKKKLIIIAGGAALLIIIIAGIFLSGMLSGHKAPEANIPTTHQQISQDTVATEQKVVYFNLDEFIVNLSKVGGQPSFLKMSVTLELLDSASADKVGEKMPLIRDAFQVYLRELRSDDLQGSAGIYRLRQELLLRINKLMYPVKINDILFREILIQ